MNSYNVIGLMSGTSLDGLDICHATYTKSSSWRFTILNTTTIDLSDELSLALKQATDYSGLELSLLNNHLGDFIGHAVVDFMAQFDIQRNEIDFIASHGHTIFHQPEKNLTLQIGNGANISAITKLPVICDFRTSDLALNGNGAPLVPIGDQLLFSDYDSCINLGGIANISFDQSESRIAFDICPVNIVLNKYANDLGLSFDDKGMLARNGKLNKSLLNDLNDLEYYKRAHPKSLGIEWIKKQVFPLLDSFDISAEDKLNTFVEHIAIAINNAIPESSGSILVTGGGAFNAYLIERITELAGHFSGRKVILPENKLIEFKEALIFGFLGVLRHRNEENVLKTATGGSSNNIGGCIYNALQN